MNAFTDVSFFPRDAKPLTSYRKYWAQRFGTAPFLPMSREEMTQLGWDSCDIIIVTGDAYVDHPSFGMSVIGRMLENQGFRVGIIAQPDWTSAEAFKALGQPNLFWGVTSGNMDSMINRYTADRKIRSDDAYTPGDVGGKRPDRAAIVYSQRCREAFKDVPIVLGGIEGSLRRIAHYDYWSDKVRRSIVVDAKCDLLLYGNAERALVEVAHRIAAREPVEQITDVRGTAFQQRVWQALQAIPAGQTASYAEVAQRIGAPTAVRAVAHACAANALAVAIPCHRVVKSDGALSGYRWGVERKRALLTREAAPEPAQPLAEKVA